LIIHNPYFEESTLYALACVLAYKRILLLAGVYSQIQQTKSDFGSILNDRLHNIESAMNNFQTPLSLYNYHRLTLAERVMERIGDRHITCSGIKKSLEPSIKKPDIKIFMDELKQLSIKIGNETGVPSSLVESK
jgi:hypothetical protein